MIEKMKQFVASLTDEEIDSQIKDIFEWAKKYKELLESEKAYRSGQKNGNDNIITPSTYSKDVCFEDNNEANYDYNNVEYEEKGIENPTVNFELAQIIQNKVATFSVEKTKEQLEKLKNIPTNNLNSIDLAQLKYEIEVCEIHLFELTGKTLDGESVCMTCGAELEGNAKFCPKCGSAVQDLLER